MRPLVVAVLLVSPLSAAAQSPRKDPPPPPAAEKLRGIADDLREARGLLKGVADRATRERLELLITRSEVAAADLARSAAEAVPAAAMSPADFAKVLAGLKANAFDDGKLTFLRGLGKTPRFSSAQAKELLAAFTFDRDRVPAAVVVYPLVADPAFFFQALEAFQFDSSRKEVREKLGLK